jgi:hypothetical protein
VNRASAGSLTVFVLVLVGFVIAVMLARSTPASQERTWWRSALDTMFGRDAVSTASNDEDRPPIVVRSGSIYFDGGDKLNRAPKWRGWTMVSNSSGTSVWKPDHTAGAAVRAFEVMAFNAIGTPTCPLAPFLADRIDLVYAGSAKPQTASIHTAADKNNKLEPVIETTLRLTALPGNDTAPDSLAYTTDGVLTGFSAAYQGHSAATCTFNAQGSGYLRVSPTR